MGWYAIAFGAVVNYGAAAFFLWQSLRRLTKWSHALGKVTALEWQSTSGDSHARFPVVRFRAKGGREYTFTSRVAVTGVYTPGMQVEVLYDPDNPDRAAVNDWWNRWGFATIGFAMGSVFSLVAWIAR